MTDLVIRLRDAGGRPLDDVADITVTAHQTGEAVASKKAVKGGTAVKVPGLDALQVYVVRAFPMRHRPVGRFVLMPASGTRPASAATASSPRTARCTRRRPGSRAPGQAWARRCSSRPTSTSTTPPASSTSSRWSATWSAVGTRYHQGLDPGYVLVT